MQIDIGPEKKRYFWHEALIAKESRLLAAGIEKWRTENADTEHLPTLELPMARTDSFQIITDWLYKRNLRENVKCLRNFAIYRLYIEALEYDIEALQNDIIDYIRTSKVLKDLSMRRTFWLLLQFMQNRTTRCAMRDFVVQSIAYHIHRSPADFTALSVSGRDIIPLLFNTHPKTAQELMTVTFAYHAASDSPYVRAIRHCFFHNHTNGSKCSAVR